MFKKSFQTSALLMVSTLALLACTKPVPTEEPIRAVRVMAVGLDNLHSGAEFAGEVRARVESRLGFRVGGKIVRRQAELGQRVKVGQVLAQLDPQDYKLAVDAGRAQVAQALTNRDLAAADFKRFKELRDQNFISSAELERREAAVKAAHAQLEQAQAQFSGQGNQAAYTTLVADVAGVVTSVDAEPGQVVAAGTPVVRIAQDGPRDVVFSVPEDRVAQIKPGSTVSVQMWAANATLKGLVREVAASADPVTRTFLVKVSLDAKDHVPLGATVSVLAQALEGSNAKVLKVPTSALVQSARVSSVWVLDKSSMTVRLQPVEVATVDGNEVVLSGGLDSGVLVVTAGVHVLAPGQKVTIYQENKAAAPADKAQTAIKKLASVALSASAATAPVSAAVAK